MHSKISTSLSRDGLQRTSLNVLCSNISIDLYRVAIGARSQGNLIKSNGNYNEQYEMYEHNTNDSNFMVGSYAIIFIIKPKIIKCRTRDG